MRLLIIENVKPTENHHITHELLVSQIDDTQHSNIIQLSR